MTRKEQLELLYKLEIAINEVEKATRDWSIELLKQDDYQKWYNAEIAYKIARTLTSTKLAIDQLLDNTHD